MADAKPLKVLCIHGYRQNSKMFKEKTGALRKMLKKYIDCDFITAPYLVPPGNQGSAAWGENKPNTDGSTGDESEGERGWWFSREDDWFKSDHVSDVDKGFDATLDLVISALEENQYDGILGFSQGACLVSMLSLLQQQQNKQWFKFAILFSGFKSHSTKHDKYYSGAKSEIPSLHVYGEGDQVVSNVMSEDVVKCFSKATVKTHPGGHFIAATSAQKQAYITFLEEMRSLCS